MTGCCVDEEDVLEMWSIGTAVGVSKDKRWYSGNGVVGRFFDVDEVFAEFAVVL